MLVLGTAGHIDHGKSAIVKRLTGTDPDRLPEEKARGMTIDLGFAFYRTSNGEHIAFVDVPGHERFVRTMIAGAGGIDAVMLVIAADDGWMPQTEEHFQIVRMLGIQDGFVIITKIDMVSDEQVKSVAANIRSRINGTFLAQAPIFPVSSVHGTGFHTLRQHLDSLHANIVRRVGNGIARLAIDRAFDLTGIGTVATGTLRDGAVSIGQPVAIWPSNTKAKIKTLHGDNEPVTEAYPSQRVSLSLSGAGKGVLERGGILTSRDELTFLLEHPVLAVHVELLSSSPVALTSRRNLIALAGTAAIEGEIRTWENREIKPGTSGVLFFLPDQPLFSLVGDPLILRLPTPVVTIGGGRLLDHLPHFPKLRELPRYAYLLNRNPADLQSVILTELEKRLIIEQKNLLPWSCFAPGTIASTVDALVQEKGIERRDGFLFNRHAIESQRDLLIRTVAAKGSGAIRVEQVAAELRFSEPEAVLLLDILTEIGALEKRSETFRVQGVSQNIPAAVERAMQAITSELRVSPFTPPPLEKFAERGKEYREAIGLLRSSGDIYKCGTQFIFLWQDWNKIVTFVRSELTRKQALTVNDLKDAFAITRRHAIPIFEELDRLQITSREGNVRVQGVKFDA